MNLFRASLTATAVVLSFSAHASTHITLDWSTLAEQNRTDVQIGFDMNWTKVPSEACYYVDFHDDELEVGCQERDDFTLISHDPVTDYATVKGQMDVPPEMVSTQESIMVKVVVNAPDGQSTASREVTLIGDSVAPEPNFDYENSVEGLTLKPVVYNNDGDIKTGVMGSEAVIERNSDKIVAGYVSDWAQFDRQFSLEAVEANAYNKLVYSFVGICGDRGSKANVVAEACETMELNEHEIAVLDMWGGLQSAISQRQVDMGWKDIYDGTSKANYDSLNISNVRGLLGQMLELKKKNPDLKLAMSIGGWTLSEPFHRMAATEESRKVFAGSIVEFIKKWGFDGVDVDWEYPGKGGESGAQGPNDAENYVKLLQDIRVKLDKAGLQNVEISSAIGATQEYIDLVGADNYRLLAGENGVLDYLYLMNYDYWGAFTPSKLGHQSNLYGTSFDGTEGANSAEKSIKILKSYGVKSERIMLGVANYNRGKQGDILEPGFPNSAINVTDKSVFGSHESTVVEGYDLYANMAGENLKGKNGFTLFTDPAVNADYYYNTNTGVYYSGDTLRTSYQKAKYAEENNLAGVFTWTVEQDHNGYTVNALNEGLGNTLSEKYTTQEQRALWNATCGDNVSKSECKILNEGERYSLGQMTPNYSLTQPNHKSVFFYVPKQDGVVHADASNANRSVWSGAYGVSFINVEVVNENNEEYVAKIRGHKKFGNRNLRMNDGVQNGYGAFYSTYSYADNIHLPAGVYTPKHPLTINAMSWSGAPEPVAQFKLDFELDHSNIEQVDINLGTWSENYALTQPGQKSVFFYVPPQEIVLSADAANADRSVWSGVPGNSFFEVKVINDQGKVYTAKVRGNKLFWGRHLRMNDGVQNGAGSFMATVNPQDNPHLPSGRYHSEEPVIIHAQSWSGAPKPIKALKLDVDFTI